MSVKDEIATGTRGTKFEVVVIPSDEDGCRFFLEKYKPFRLASLQQDPHAFGSTYAREIGFDDETWLSRIKNPLATTFVAVQSADKQVVASTSLIGPLPNAAPASNPYQIVSEAIPRSDATANSSHHAEPLCFQMSAVYTSPEARGQGLAKSLIEAATEEARSRAHGQGRPLVLSVVVYATNSAAISVYERCGFARGVEEPKLVFNAFKNSSEMQLDMYYQGAC
ncbi:hypothetical protein NUW58_g4317 [Xylaria curta]|uniref:Uncharacterized protein n=1 Tax=Xylaria curta TaxID=42375 RepID=A0ACC1P9P2_9PEZI|nr:hypothetical protein NUW58_g4317 [Xylaria curta]